MKRIALSVFAGAALLAGLAIAQGPGAGRFGQGPRVANQQADPQQWAQWRVDRLGFMLNLTESQKTQAKAIFEQSINSSQELRAEMLKTQDALRTAVRASNIGQIEKLSATLGALNGKLRAIHAVAAADMYNRVLTPAQREQADKTGCDLGAGFGAGRGMGRGGFGFGPMGRGMNCPFATAL